jgi:predicted nucleotidyltransferase
MMFSAAQRAQIRDAMVARAREDVEIVGAALVGSAARHAEDAWSDIDLVLQLDDGVDEPELVERWTAWMSAEFGVSDAFDVIAAGGIRYRVFLLASSLQIDLSFWPRDRFRATEEAFHVLFGEPNAPTPPAAPSVGDTVGLAWLYALHARSAIARGRLWQAQLMLDDLRNGVLTLRCLHAGLNPWHGREVDRLPVDILERMAAARAREVSDAELRRSLAALGGEFLDAVDLHDSARRDRLAGPLGIIVTGA